MEEFVGGNPAGTGLTWLDLLLTYESIEVMNLLPLYSIYRQYCSKPVVLVCSVSAGFPSLAALLKKYFHGTPTQKILDILSAHSYPTNCCIQVKALFVVGVPLIIILIWKSLLAETPPGLKGGVSPEEVFDFSFSATSLCMARVMARTLRISELAYTIATAFCTLTQDPLLCSLARRETLLGTSMIGSLVQT